MAATPPEAAVKKSRREIILVCTRDQDYRPAVEPADSLIVEHVASATLRRCR
jgi:hypothetical protein